VQEGGEADYNDTRAQLVARDTEVQSLQRALSDAHVFLYEEREKVLMLSAENDALRIQDGESRQRIEHLLALVEPANQEVTYFPADMPSAQTSVSGTRGFPTTFVHIPPPNASSSSSSSSASSSSSSSKKKKKNAGGVSDPHLLRTVILPNDNADALKQTIQSLRVQLAEQAQLSTQTIAALREDRGVREQEYEEHERRHAHVLDSAVDRNTEFESLYKQTMLDLLSLRERFDVSEQTCAETVSFCFFCVSLLLLRSCSPHRSCDLLSLREHLSVHRDSDLSSWQRSFRQHHCSDGVFTISH
jgi:coiled-coil domain-containing protein 77